MSSKLNAISLFSNCGAGDIGFKTSGFDFKIMAELESKRLEVALLNHPNARGIEGDLLKTWSEVVSTYRDIAQNTELHLLTACPPCQGFSSARGRRGKKNDAKSGMFDNRNMLSHVISKVALALNPTLIVIENVPIFLSRKLLEPKSSKSISGANILIKSLEEKFHVYPLISDLSDFGIPQTRKRSVIVFINKNRNDIISHLSSNMKFPFPQVSHVEGKKQQITIREELEKHSFPPLYSNSLEKSQNLKFHPLHTVPFWPPDRVRMVEAIPIHTGKSAWNNNQCGNCKHENSDEDYRCNICNSMLDKPIVETEEGHRLIKGFKTSYKRMASNKPASTILTASGHIGSHNTIHPYENRLLSALECQILQTIPKNFKWGNAVEKYGYSNIRKMIGEAVPPKFTRLHGRVLNDLIAGGARKRLLSSDDSRVKRALKMLRE